MLWLARIMKFRNVSPSIIVAKSVQRIHIKVGQLKFPSHDLAQSPSVICL
jgi:hypothetical protein